MRQKDDKEFAFMLTKLARGQNDEKMTKNGVFHVTEISTNSVSLIHDNSGNFEVRDFKILLGVHISTIYMW